MIVENSSTATEGAQFGKQYEWVPIPFIPFIFGQKFKYKKCKFKTKTIITFYKIEIRYIKTKNNLTYKNKNIAGYKSRNSSTSTAKNE